MSSLSKFKKASQGNHYGIVVSSKDNVVNIYGLRLATSGEMVINKKGFIGLVLNLSKYLTGIITFENNSFELGNFVARLFTTLSVKINPFTLGNVYDGLGRLLNNPNFLQEKSFSFLYNEFNYMIRNVEVKAPGIIVREPVYESLYTGFIGVDGLLPLGRGQRELIIGDRQTGKTALAVDSIINQTNLNTVLFDTILV